MAFQDDEWGDDGGSVPVMDDAWSDIDIASDYLIEKKEKVTISTGKNKGVRMAVPAENPLDVFGRVRRQFIIQHLRTIALDDIARLMRIEPGELRAAIEKIGVTLSLERARPWAALNVGTYESSEVCSRCQVQIRHTRFLVGYRDCRACLEDNIALWTEMDELTRLVLPGENAMEG